MAKSFNHNLTKEKIIRVGVVVILVVACLRFFLVPLSFRFGREKPFMVRVRVAHEAEELKLESESACDIHDADTGGMLGKKVPLPSGTMIVPVEEGVSLGGKIYATDRMRVSPSGGEKLMLNGTRYRGEMDLARTGTGLLDAVNRVGIEDYLKGVLPREVHYFWPFAVLKAQAISSRSFAVYQVLRRKKRSYDLTADTFSQAYGGMDSERWRTTRAVEATRGRILSFRGRVFPAYFHSCCGGHTQDALRLWDEDVEPLRGGRCVWCRWTPHFRWQKRVSAKIILEALQDKGYGIRRIDDIKEGARDVSGRLEYVRVRAGNKWFDVDTKDFRSALGRKILKSAKFRVRKYPGFYLFSGYGWGHGVGMCQWGAFGLSVRRWNTERILEQYYPGAEIVDMKDVL